MASALTVAVAQLEPAKGDYEGNLRLLGEVLTHLSAQKDAPDVVVFPETVLSGYFVEGGVREVAVSAGQLAHDLARSCSAHGGLRREMDVVVGFYERWRQTLYNSAAYVRLADGGAEVLHVHRKVFLPTYGLFDEERFVERGHDIRAFDTPWGRAAILVCEDAWHSLSSTTAAVDGAQLIFVLSAAPARGVERGDRSDLPASAVRWERLISEIAREHGVFVVFANLVGSEGGKLFSGYSHVCGPRGEMILSAPAFDEAIVSTTIEFDEVGRARSDEPLLADLRTALPHLRRALERVERGEARALDYDDTAESNEARGGPPAEEGSTTTGQVSHRIASIPIISPPEQRPAGPPSLEIDADLVRRWLVRFLQAELARRQMTQVVVGLSGGVDSAVTTYLAAEALGAENVLALRMPYRTSSPESLSHAQLVIDALGIPAKTIDISPAVDGYLALEPEADSLRRGNVMARIRMTALFDQSARIRGIPLGTGNKSERLLGYFTWHADDSPPVNPLGDLFKSQVWQLARALGVPAVIIDKPASADLVAGQTDEGDFGISYARADEILHWLISGYATPEVVRAGYTAEEVERVRKRLDGTHWKRRLPTVAMVSQSAIGESYLRPVDY